MTYLDPSFPTNFGGSSAVNGMSQQRRYAAAAAPPFPTLSSVPTPSTPSYDFQSIPLVSQAYGPLPTKLGVATANGSIQVETQALEGPIDGGNY